MSLAKKYVQLIAKQNGLHASFEPSRPVEVGDYGSIDKETGAFLSEGNIFERKGGKKSLAEHLGIEIIANEAPVYHVYCSKTANVLEESPKADCGISTLDLAASFNVQFRKGGAAVLIFRRGTLQSMRHEGRLQQGGFGLFFKGKTIVTRLWSTPTYVICVSSKQEQTFSISFEVSALTPFGITPGVGITSTFKRKGGGDCLQIGYPPKSGLKSDYYNGNHFCPLFHLGRTSKALILNGVPLGMYMSLASLSTPDNSSDTSQDSRDPMAHGLISHCSTRESMPMGMALGGNGMPVGTPDILGAMALPMSAIGSPILGTSGDEHSGMGIMGTNVAPHENCLEEIEYPWESEDEDSE